MANATETRLPLALAASFTARALTPVLTSWLERLGLATELRWAEHGQLFQALLEPNGALRANKNGISIALVRRVDLGDRHAEAARDLRDAIASSVGASGCPHIVILCPSEGGPPNADEAVADLLREVTGADVVTASQIARAYPVANVHDSFADREGNVPYTEEYFAALGTMLARRIRVQRTPPKKAILVDCDDTLWTGICGEVGAQSVVIDEPRLAFQRYLLAQRAEGVLLCVVSKNNEADALAVFERPEMLVRREHITTWRINWAPKSDNIADIGRELSLGVDSFVFFDDDAYVCAEARERCPGLVALQLPADPKDLPRFVNGLWVFDRGSVTDEDRGRADAYRAEQQREHARVGTSHADFLAKLDLVVKLEPMGAEHVARVAQLILRTNQFNATGIRRSEAEVRTLGALGLEVHVVSVRDRFGDYGITGAVIAGMQAGSFVVEALLLSCRVLGRGVEQDLVRQLAAIARDRGATGIWLPFVPTSKNAPYAAFFDALPGRRATSNGRSVVIAPIPELLELRYAPGAADAGSDGRMSRTSAAPVGLPDTMDYASVALTLSSVDEILAAVAGYSPKVSGMVARAVGTLEEELAKIWREILKRDSVDITADLFEIGGDSLSALRILARVHQQFHVEIPLHVLFQADATITWMASHLRGSRKSLIDLRELSDEADTGEIA